MQSETNIKININNVKWYSNFLVFNIDNNMRENTEYKLYLLDFNFIIKEIINNSFDMNKNFIL
jgi:hypothetical protein